MITAWVLVRDDGRLYGGDQWVAELHMAVTFAGAQEVHDTIRERKRDASPMFSERRTYMAKPVGIDDDGRLKETAFV